MLGELANGCAGPTVPQSRRSIRRSGGEVAAIRAERHIDGPRLIDRQVASQSPRSRVPESRTPIGNVTDETAGGSGGGQQAAVGTEGQLRHAIPMPSQFGKWFLIC